MKLTPQRLAILGYLDGNTTHPTAEQIYEGIKKECPTVSFATVYNTIQILRDKGELRELTIDPVRKHYDPNTEDHHHVICSDCKTVGDVMMDFSEVIRTDPDLLDGFKITNSDINFYGACKECQELSEPPQAASL